MDDSAVNSQVNGLIWTALDTARLTRNETVRLHA
jgi:hypothetical protein